MAGRRGRARAAQLVGVWRRNPHLRPWRPAGGPHAFGDGAERGRFRGRGLRSAAGKLCAPPDAGHRRLARQRVCYGDTHLSRAFDGGEGRRAGVGQQRRPHHTLARTAGCGPARAWPGPCHPVVARHRNRRPALVKLLRTIRLDASDAFVFERAATPGEWAVSGAFAFTHLNVSALTGKARAAFRSGFLGIETLGWSTLAEVVEASSAERDVAIERLAQQLVERFAAPDLACARSAAAEEIDFSAALSDHPKGMLVAVSRRFEDGAIREAFRTLTPSIGPKPLRAYAFLEVVGEEEEEVVDLTSIDQIGPKIGKGDRS